MKVQVFSDSHTDIEIMVDAVERDRPDYIIHLGDHTADANTLSLRFPDIPLAAVRGNTDSDSAYPDELLLEYGGVKVFAAHGHRFWVRLNLNGFKRRAVERDARLALFGHTHISYLKNDGGVWLMNPGRAGRNARGSGEPSCGIVTVNDGDFTCEIKSL